MCFTSAAVNGLLVLSPSDAVEPALEAKAISVFGLAGSTLARPRPTERDPTVRFIVFAKGLSYFTGSTGDTNSFLTLLDTHREYSQYTNTHQFLANAIYQLPIGKGRKFLTKTNSVINHLIGGWQISSIVKYTSGDPLSIFSGLPNSTSGRGTINRDGLSGSNTVDVAGGLDRNQLSQLLGIRTTTNGVYYIDPNLAPGSTSDATKVIFLNPKAGTVGALGLSSIKSPNYFNTDLSLLKRTRLTEKINFEFRAEFFNLFNNVNFDNPETDINETNFGKITNIVGKPRLMQFALRLNF